MKAAIYAYSATDLAHRTSIDQQIKICRQLISSKDWTVCEDYIRSDSGTAATFPSSREGLQSLLAAATLNPCPFDYVVMDETSRLGRTYKAFNLIERFRHLGVSLYFVATNEDTSVPLSSIGMILTHMIDAEFFARHAANVHRGQNKRVLKGIVSGGLCYGYNKTPIENRTCKSECITQAISGYRIDINQSEAEVVRRIFDLFGSGAYNLGEIASELCEHGVPPPKSRKVNLNTGWTATGLLSILNNERYRGIILWNKTRSVRHPETGKKKVICRPMSEWVTVKNDDIRIVSEEQWEKVKLQIQRKSSITPKPRAGIFTALARKVRILMNVFHRFGERQERE
jgi:DNA invertase Pin-like site-specific DNA recombinase